jgi:hypothetical protein
MHPLARSFALRAAAKVTLSLGAASCGGMVDEVKPDVPPAREEHDSATTSVTIDAPDVGNTCSATNVAFDGGASREVFDCCLPVVAGALPADAGWSGAFSPEKENDPAVVACCHEIIAHLEESGDASTVGPDDYARASDRGALQACCRTLKAFSTPTCTPWGPPAPPPFDWEVA